MMMSHIGHALNDAPQAGVRSVYTVVISGPRNIVHFYSFAGEAGQDGSTAVWNVGDEEKAD